jgi:hypothetical protein
VFAPPDLDVSGLGSDFAVCPCEGEPLPIVEALSNLLWGRIVPGLTMSALLFPPGSEPVGVWLPVHWEWGTAEWHPRDIVCYPWVPFCLSDMQCAEPFRIAMHRCCSAGLVHAHLRPPGELTTQKLCNRIDANMQAVIPGVTMRASAGLLSALRSPSSVPDRDAVAKAGQGGRSSTSATS